MNSFTTIVFSWRMRLSSVAKHKIPLSMGVLFIVGVIVLGPPIYQESWLDPFGTLNVPNRELHPHAITMMGMVNSDDPFQPYYYTNKGKIQELLRDLQRATPLSSKEETSFSLENQKVQYFTLHRTSSNFHTEEDLALQYYPGKGIIRFRNQAFRINESAIYAFTQITVDMSPGWWK